LCKNEFSEDIYLYLECVYRNCAGLLASICVLVFYFILRR